MPKVVIIVIFAIVACCRVVSMAGPFMQSSFDTLATWYDQECGSEDTEVKKASQESKEDTWLSEIVLENEIASFTKSTGFADKNLLEYTRKPLNPPPNMI